MAKTKLNPASSAERIADSLQRGVVWRVWHCGRREYCWNGRSFETRKQAENACVSVTRGRRNKLTNYWRIATRLVPVNPDGSSPQRDICQKEWDSKMGAPDNSVLGRTAAKTKSVNQ